MVNVNILLCDLSLARTLAAVRGYSVPATGGVCALTAAALQLFGEATSVQKTLVKSAASKLLRNT